MNNEDPPAPFPIIQKQDFLDIVNYAQTNI